MPRLVLLVLVLFAADAAAMGTTLPPDPGRRLLLPVQDGGRPAPVYEKDLLRLSEILGALFFLRNLCGADDAVYWRDTMLGVLEAENPESTRRAHLVARFNHGAETFRSVYRSCTPSARRSIERYLDEGEKLASDMTTRYAR